MHFNSEILIISPNDFSDSEVIPLIVDLSLLADQNFQEIELEVVKLTNLERVARNIHPLTLNKDLSKSALLHTLDMAENHFIRHTGSDGADLKKRIYRVSSENWVILGENLAMGQQTPKQVIEGWMNSPGHRENLLNDKFFEIGVAFIMGEVIAPNGNTWRGGYWTQHFGTRLSAKYITPTLLNWWTSLFELSSAREEDKNLNIEILD